MIPGGNLLRVAMGLIGPQVVQWMQFTGMTQNAAGFNVPAWADAVDVTGSFQAVPRSLYQVMGLDLSKNYGMFYATREFTTPERDRAGDRLIYGGRIYQVESSTSWYAQDGWDGVLCVEVPNVGE